jgi:DNA-binding NarL/FixJ family response regulator
VLGGQLAIEAKRLEDVLSLPGAETSRSLIEVPEAGPYSLTLRQREVLTWVSQGKSLGR